MRFNLAAAALVGVQIGFTQCFLPRYGGSVPSRSQPPEIALGHVLATGMRRSAFINLNNQFEDKDDEDDENEDEDDDEEDPYTSLARTEFMDDKRDKGSLSTLSGSTIDWGGELGKLRKRVDDVESGKSNPSTALFRLMSADTPNQLIGKFVSSADPKVVKACSDAVNSLLGGLSSPAMGVETIVKTNGDKIASLCFQLMMTGYLFRQVEYVLALKEIMNIKSTATLKDYKKAFSRLDRDGSGFIEASEVKSLLDDVYEGNAPRFEVEAFMKFFDKNSDGRISWSEFETGLGAAMSEQAKPNKLLGLIMDSHDDEDDPLHVEPDVSGELEIELDSGKIITVDAKEYIDGLKSEAESLKKALQKELLGSKPQQNGIISAPPQPQQDFGGIAQYIASRQGDIKALTEGIQPEIVDTMKLLVDFVLEGGGNNGRKDVPKEEIEMELPGAALQQLALWQLVLGYRLREAEATGEYLKLLE